METAISTAIEIGGAVAGGVALVAASPAVASAAAAGAMVAGLAAMGNDVVKLATGYYGKGLDAKAEFKRELVVDTVAAVAGAPEGIAAAVKGVEATAEIIRDGAALARAGTAVATHVSGVYGLTIPVSQVKEH